MTDFTKADAIFLVQAISFVAAASLLFLVLIALLAR
jgi:hypothetical protein